MKKIFSALFCLSFLTAQAQDLTIYYDFIQDKYKYVQKGKEVKKPSIMRNYEVKVVVENLNPYVFIASCNWQETTVQDNASVSGLASMFSGFALPGAGNITSLLGGLNMQEIESLTAVDRGAPSLLESNPFAKMSLDNTLDAYNKLFEIEQTIIRMDHTADKLRKLKYNPYLPGDTLKEIARMMVLNSINGNSVNQNQNLSATRFIQLSSQLDNNLHEQYDNFLTSANNFLMAYQSFSLTNGNNFNEAGIDRKIKNLMFAADALNSRYNGEIINTKVESLEEQYESIHYTPFTYVCNRMATGDRLTLTLDVYETSPYSRNNSNITPGGQSIDTLRKIRTKTLNILVEGDIKITTSVGLGFPSYGKNNVTYSNRDSLVSSTAGSNFSPCISTFLNFYPYSGKNVHWGGSFGVGIPVQNEGVSALNFFLGGSCVLGAGSRVVINGGLAIGQLTLLDNGLKVNDNLGDEFTLPATKKGFKPGGFFGISFAISK